MARPHIEFIQSQWFSWQRGLYEKFRPGVDTKVLSQDGETGAASLLQRYPRGWSQRGKLSLSADEELFVVQGELRINDVVYGPHTYAYLPAGYTRKAAASPIGAVVLTMFEAEPEVQDDASGKFDRKLLVAFVDGMEGSWGGVTNPKFPPGGGRKMLRVDPYTQDESWILGTMPLRNGLEPEIHPTIEETYLLAGDVAGNLGTMRPGAYFWRPKGVPHGPYGTRTGNLYFFRTKGGALSTEYGEAQESFDWNPDYAPALPPELQQYATYRFDGARNY